jgi:hypothetical protein
MTEPFIPTPYNCTINGGRFRGYVAWENLDWGRAQWCLKASLMVVLVGPEDAPDDPHWSVPHKDGETWHRVRLRKRRAKAGVL